MTTTTAPATVHAVLDATVAAWDAADADAFADLYSAEATVVLGTGAFLRGREEIRAYMSAGFAGPLGGTRGFDEQISTRVLGDTAIVVSNSGFMLPGEDAVAPERQRKATWVLARQGGDWLVESYHNC
jgi:uncharacterized protein (TIGR02246 family)